MICIDIYNLQTVVQSQTVSKSIIQVLPTVDRADPPVKKVNAIDTHQAALATTPAPSAWPAPLPVLLAGVRSRILSVCTALWNCCGLLAAAAAAKLMPIAET